MELCAKLSVVVSGSIAVAACSSGGASSALRAADAEVSAAAELDAGRVDWWPFESGVPGTEAGATCVDTEAEASFVDGIVAPDGAALAPASSAADVGPPCFLKSVGVSGTCIDVSACAALGGHLSTPGLCSGPPTISCCTPGPHVEEHPHPPAGYLAVPQSRVTSAMTSWALAIVGSPTLYPMGSRTTVRFGERDVMARVEWHPPDFGHGVIHRGVTLYEPR